MPLTVSAEERKALETAQARSPQVRHWRRYQAVLLRAAGVLVAEVAEVARDLACSEASVSNWTAAWQMEGLDGVAEGRHPGAARRLEVAAEEALDTLVAAGDPQAHGYAAARLRRRTATPPPTGPRRCCGLSWPSAAGRSASGPFGARCTAWGGDGSGLGWRWKRPK